MYLNLRDEIFINELHRIFLLFLQANFEENYYKNKLYLSNFETIISITHYPLPFIYFIVISI
jgi:hypothetical protein